MNYVGKTVVHKAKFGKGIITSQDEKGYIFVKFESEVTDKKFKAPGCFKQFLQLEDTEAAARALEDNRIKDEADKAAAERKRQEAQARSLSKTIESREQSSRSEKTVRVPSFSSIEDFYAEQERMLLAEISYLRKNGGKRTKILDGKLVEAKYNRYIYSFESDSELNLPDNTQISLCLSGSQDSIPAVIINCEDFTVIIATGHNFGQSISSIEFSAEPWRLLQYLIDRLQTLQKKPSSIVKEIVCNGRKKIRYGKAIFRGQDNACRMSLAQPITFIWGPPGTGKTETLAKIALQHLSKGYRVLMLSYSNVSVDGAIWRVFKKDIHKKPGRLVRYGYPRDKSLLQHEYLTSYNLTLKNHPELMRERASLAEKRKHLSRTSKEYVEAGRRLTQIKSQIDVEEKKAVSDAAFVATTVSKAIADSTLYDSSYDTVIFDEASMAYIPQIVFSAGLAARHFICMGDFAQLPPIVQSDSSNSLNADIFKYCGIVDAVESGYGHEWLCMLDTQYRMHPDIAAFSSRTMYHGLLKSGSDMAKQREEIVRSVPFSGDALRLVDLSGMMSVCTKTADQSRINVLSAMISMGLATNASFNQEVGIITPYNAQSRLLHAMSRDVAEQAPNLEKITCATVHQFQGSEQGVIIYDAVDCYRMPYPGTLLSSMANNYANRLYNVAVTRAKGKMISIVNVDYMKAKNFSKKLIFRNMMDSLISGRKATRGDSVLPAVNSEILRSFLPQEGGESFLKDITDARKEIFVDIPGGTGGSSSWFGQLAKCLSDAKKRGVKVFLRTDNKKKIPSEIRAYVIENKFVSNPIALIDKKVVWYGMLPSRAEFMSEGRTIPTLYRPIFRFVGKHFAQSLYGFLEMNRTVDSAAASDAMEDDGTYNTFGAYVAGEMKCSECGGAMQLKKSKRGKFFLACSNYPKCEMTQFVDPDPVERYFYHNKKNGKRCPRDNTSLEANVGRYGLYVCCCAIERHYFKLDEI